MLFPFYLFIYIVLGAYLEIRHTSFSPSRLDSGYLNSSQWTSGSRNAKFAIPFAGKSISIRVDELGGARVHFGGRKGSGKAAAGLLILLNAHGQFRYHPFQQDHEIYQVQPGDIFLLAISPDASSVPEDCLSILSRVINSAMPFEEPLNLSELALEIEQCLICDVLSLEYQAIGMGRMPRLSSQWEGPYRTYLLPKLSIIFPNHIPMPVLEDMSEELPVHEADLSSGSYLDDIETSSHSSSDDKDRHPFTQ